MRKRLRACVRCLRTRKQGRWALIGTIAICLHRIPPRVLHFSVFIHTVHVCKQYQSTSGGSTVGTDTVGVYRICKCNFTVCTHSHRGCYQCTHELKTICIHLSPGSQLVCLPTQTLVIVTAARIFAVNLRVAFVCAGRVHALRSRAH